MEDIQKLQNNLKLLKDRHNECFLDRKRLLHIIGTLIDYLEDSNSEFLAEHCYELVRDFDFDVRNLPDEVLDNVMKLMKADKMESYYLDMAEDVL